jgi:hypothetical protein
MILTEDKHSSTRTTIWTTVLILMVLPDSNVRRTTRGTLYRFMNGQTCCGQVQIQGGGVPARIDIEHGCNHFQGQDQPKDAARRVQWCAQKCIYQVYIIWIIKWIKILCRSILFYDLTCMLICTNPILAITNQVFYSSKLYSFHYFTFTELVQCSKNHLIWLEYFA